MKYLAYVVVALVLVVVGGVLAVNAGLMQSFIESEVRAKVGPQAQLGRVEVPLRWPPTVQVGPSQFPMGGVQTEFRALSVTLVKVFQPYDIRVHMVEPKVKVQGSMASIGEAPTPQGQPGARSEPPRFRLALTVVKGEFSAPELGIRDLELEFEQKLWMKSPVRIQLGAKVRTAYLPGEVPVTLKTDNLQISEDSIKATGVNASFAGLKAVVQGTTLLKDGRHRWVAEVKAPDLSQVPAPIELPATQWQGSVEVNAELTKEGPTKPWAADGRGVFKNVRAMIQYKNEKVVVRGPLALDVQARFSYANELISVPALSGYVDLEQAQVEAYGLLAKAPNVPLRVEMDAAGTAEKLELKKLVVQLWQLKGAAHGHVAMKAPFDGTLSVDLQPTALKGLEAVLTPLKNSLVQGEIAVQGEWTGPFTDPWASKIVLRSLRLKNFSSDVNYDTAGALKARGPIAATIEATGEIDKGLPKSFKANGQVQLGGVALVAGPLRKEAQQPLSANFAVRSDGVALQIDQMAVTGFLGQIKASGSVREPQKPKVNLRVEMKPLNLSELRVALPEFRELIPKGDVAGTVHAHGELVTTLPWYQWPLAVSGTLKVNLPEYRVATAAAVSGGGAPDSVPAVGDQPALSGFLPSGHLTEKLNLLFGATIGLLVKDALTVKGVEANGRIQAGKYTGTLQMREIFGGKVVLSEMNVPLLESLPLVSGQLAVENLVVQDAMAFAKPEYKEMAIGRATGATSFETRLPADTRFMDELKAKGQVTLSPITLNTVRVGQMLNDMIKKVPVLKLPQAKVAPLKGSLKADYTLERQAVSLAPLTGRDEDGSELEMTGKVALATFQGDLAGNFYWANPQVKGCLLEGNADSQGRMVVPIALKGNLMQPELSVVSDVANKIAGRALECEKNKMVDQIKKDGGKKLEQEAKKALKGLLGQ